MSGPLRWGGAGEPPRWDDERPWRGDLVPALVLLLTLVLVAVHLADRQADEVLRRTSPPHSPAPIVGRWVEIPDTAAVVPLWERER